MAFFKRQDLGRVYVLKIILPDDTVVHKIGMCHSSRSTDRMMEILRSWFSYYRFVPYCELKLDMECRNSLKLEKYIHEILEATAFEPNFNVEGKTEMFINLDEARVIKFIRNCENSNYAEFPRVDRKTAQVMCNLLTLK